MNQFLLLASFITIAACGRLENLYLPPSSARSFSHSGSNYQQYSTGSSSNQVPIVRFDVANEGDGTYNYAYETGNGIAAQEQGEARENEAGTRAHGSYSYTSPEGEHISVTYTADENGFVPQGSHIPTPPPVPEAIARAVQQNLADEARGVVDDGQYRAEYAYQGRAQSNGGYNYNSAASQRSNGGYHYDGAASQRSTSFNNGGYRY